MMRLLFCLRYFFLRSFGLFRANTLLSYFLRLRWSLLQILLLNALILFLLFFGILLLISNNVLFPFLFFQTFFNLLALITLIVLLIFNILIIILFSFLILLILSLLIVCFHLFWFFYLHAFILLVMPFIVFLLHFVLILVYFRLLSFVSFILWLHILCIIMIRFIQNMRHNLNENISYQICQNDKIIIHDMSRTPKSQSLSRSQSSNKFFQDNAIKPPPISKMSSYSTHNIQNVNNIDLVNHYSSTRSFSQTQAQIGKTNQQLNQQLNSTGFGNSKSRLNPKQFLHREVFNTKLYQNQEGGGMKKYFKIQLPKNQREQAGLPQPFGEYLKQYTKTIAQNNYHQNSELKKLWKTILHHIHLLQKNTFMIPSTQPIKLSLKNTLSSLQSYLLAISAHIVPLQNYKKQQELNILNLQRKKEIVTEHQLKKLEQLNSSRLENQMNEHNIINKYKSKLNYMDFQLKKYVLRVQKLEEELSQMKDEIKTLRQSNLTMKKERQNIQKWKQDYQYKIKKLKEELEVAHIVKEQNLQDKFNYILGWKL